MIHHPTLQPLISHINSPLKHQYLKRKPLSKHHLKAHLILKYQSTPDSLEFSQDLKLQLMMEKEGLSQPQNFPINPLRNYSIKSTQLQKTHHQMVLALSTLMHGWTMAMVDGETLLPIDTLTKRSQKEGLLEMEEKNHHQEEENHLENHIRKATHQEEETLKQMDHLEEIIGDSIIKDNMEEDHQEIHQEEEEVEEEEVETEEEEYHQEEDLMEEYHQGEDLLEEDHQEEDHLEEVEDHQDMFQEED